jgi:hypothetical protein
MLYHRRNDWSAYNASPNNNVPKITNYFLINAAVAQEAFDGSATQQQDMVNKDWDGYNSQLRATEWHNLFADNASDARGKLTWRDRLGLRPTTTYYNFYSQGDQVLEPQPYDDTITASAWAMYKDSGRYAWALSEKYKGMLPIEWMLGSGFGGWRFNIPAYPRSAVFPELIMTADDANKIDPTVLRTTPFVQFAADDATGLLNQTTGSQYAMLNRDKLLAYAFPALTLPTGRVRAIAFPSDKSFDMQMTFKTGKTTCAQSICWPRSRLRPDWQHSDVREVGYLYIYPLFVNLANPGGTNP